MYTVGMKIRSLHFAHLSDSYYEGIVTAYDDTYIHCDCTLSVIEGNVVGGPETFMTVRDGLMMMDSMFSNPRITILSE